MHRYNDDDENLDKGAGELGGRGPIDGIRGLVLQDLMRRMDDRMSKGLEGRGRRSSYAGGKMTGYQRGGETPKFDRHGR